MAEFIKEFKCGCKIEIEAYITQIDREIEFERVEMKHCERHEDWMNEGLWEVVNRV